MKIVLYQPEIPQNTGNIGRTCVATDTELILVKPLGFFIGDKEIKRSGLDYWQDLKLQQINSLEEIPRPTPPARIWYLSTKGKRPYYEAPFHKEDVLVFGSEGSGLPAQVFEKYPDQILTIPMWGPVRSLNLASSVSIVLYEAYRQLGCMKGKK